MSRTRRRPQHLLPQLRRPDPRGVCVEGAEARWAEDEVLRQGRIDGGFEAVAGVDEEGGEGGQAGWCGREREVGGLV